MDFPKGSFNRQVPTTQGGYLSKMPVVEGAPPTPSHLLIDAEQEAAYQYAVATGQIEEKVWQEENE